METELRDAYHRSLLGRELSILVEGALQPASTPGGFATVQGTACRYAQVVAAAPPETVNYLTKVRAMSLLNHQIQAEWLPA